MPLQTLLIIIVAVIAAGAVTFWLMGSVAMSGLSALVILTMLLRIMGRPKT
ncbi:hypothetical protein [Cochlodiniinecator piscidefendens]|uniref:hypothetical protein n=1 Tax=Cochlodiniinecator piscidefendens TaxID=2715756 RepID=UPI00140A1B55|nr:hypothetical protein [Cochlodiniinecator piscidefendens]